MATRSTIMDTNSFRAEHAAALDEQTRRLTERRQEVLGGSYRLFYRKPVHLVRGQGQYLWDAEGNKYLDMYNNVASIGHAHPAVVDAVHGQMQQLNTHTRYLHERILDYTEELRTTLPEYLTAGDYKAMYMCTGSEANDLAIRVAKAYTGGTGLIATAEAYHGTSELTSSISPALGSGQPIGEHVWLLPAPDSYRTGVKDIGAWFAQKIRDAIAEMTSQGVTFAGFIADSIFSSDGVLPGTYLKEAIDAVHEAGGVFIADEVQPGFARTGEEFWGFACHGVSPDIITMGKPMGNGIPVSGLLARSEVLASFSDTIPYFSTFGGNPVSMAAAQAVLEVIRCEGLQAHALDVGAQALDSFRQLATAHENVGDVRGSGLFIGFELVRDRDTREPARDLALAMLEELRSRGVLTSVAGPHGNVLKLRPPLPFSEQDIPWATQALDESLSVLTR
ncbi:aspartate aminotransferase family protein [Nesterenkonia flava]|uniref:Aminotransferase class III-fold pyridoxal phosphate-dependent enzyme n=1 Tax=Nesterenkonia flava TaxID=469799 RepID=A0ABU1FUA8_9MICC|nr:aminotransferase class III-fold pyridoxal phosphate-dependent enzyme [Nesterenkonia flava]MDR5712255.1 aminotransferase class III-fold pyridoxal phosphate-dependent enzyme [Nesterenkonia flava]